MKLGVCVDWKKDENLLIAKAAGADYVELNFQSFWQEKPETIAALAARLRQLGLDHLAYNGMLPGSLRITGEKKDHAAAQAYLAEQLEKLQALPARIVVLGSCASRMLDGDNTKENAMREMASFLRDYAAPLLERYGSLCVIEPLSECNFLRTVQDGLALVRMVDRPCVRLLADFYHVAVCGESLAGYEAYAPYLCHTHIAARAGRAYPQKGDEDDYPAIFRALRAASYTGAMSIEAATPLNEEGLRSSLTCLRHAAL